MTDPLDLDRIEELASRATPGPWETVRPRINVRIMAGENYILESGTCGVRTEEDAQFIAAARMAVPALVAEVRRLRRGLSALNDEVCQTLGAVLNYPRFADDPANFPGATDGTCVGEHVAETIAAEAARRVQELEALTASLSERCHKQSELLSKRAEKAATDHG